MNTYFRFLRHINMKDVKIKHQEKLIEKKAQEEKKKEEEKYIASVMEEKKYDWRKELNEQMTTSDVFYTSLPAVGDVDLQSAVIGSSDPDWSWNDSSNGGTLTLGGDPDPYLYNSSGRTFVGKEYDTLVFDVSTGGTTFIVGTYDANLITSSSSGTYSVKYNGSQVTLLFFTNGAGTVNFSNFRFQRRTPKNVIVPLDSPEATSFVRTGSGDLSPEEKQKRLKDMLEASDQYVQQIHGDDFPGSGAVPPGEAGDTPGVEIQDYQIASEPLRGQKTDVKYDPKMKMFVPRPSEKDEGELIKSLVRNA